MMSYPAAPHDGPQKPSPTPEHRLIDPHLVPRQLPGQGHHDRARVEGADLRSPLQQFPHVKTGPAGRIQDPPTGDRP